MVDVEYERVTRILEENKKFVEKVQKEKGLTKEQIREKFLGKKVDVHWASYDGRKKDSTYKKKERILHEDEEGFYVKHHGTKAYVNWYPMLENFRIEHWRA